MRLGNTIYDCLLRVTILQLGSDSVLQGTILLVLQEAVLCDEIWCCESRDEVCITGYDSVLRDAILHCEMRVCTSSCGSVLPDLQASPMPPAPWLLACGFLFAV